jgi:hypothetical protein
MTAGVEVWAAVPGFTNYEVSSRGRIRSLSRVVERGNGSPMSVGERILRPSTSRSRVRIPSVTLTDGPRRRSFYVHKLVLLVHGEIRCASTR